MKKVKLEDNLYERARRCAEEVGYASVDELIAHAVEKQFAHMSRNLMPLLGGS